MLNVHLIFNSHLAFLIGRILKKRQTIYYSCQRASVVICCNYSLIFFLLGLKKLIHNTDFLDQVL